MYCGNCGAEIKDGELYCGNCGAKISNRSSSDVQNNDARMRPMSNNYAQGGSSSSTSEPVHQSVNNVSNVPEGHHRKTKICKYCGSEIPAAAKICPFCRKKQKSGPGCFTTVLAVIVFFVIISALNPGKGDSNSSRSTSTNKTVSSSKSSSSSTTGNKRTSETKKEEEIPIEYTAVTVKTMVDDLETNAMKAQEKYKNQYLEITGYLTVIDSSGKYISLDPDRYSLTGVSCDINNDSLRAQVANMSVGDTVTLRGKCTSVGEVMGYSLDVYSIDGYESTARAVSFPVSDDGYIVVSADDMDNMMHDNALQAQNTFLKQKISVTGKLGSIDSNGHYFSVDPSDDWSFNNIQCYIKNDEQKAIIMELSKGDSITVKGICTDVGEIIGYQVDVEFIEN